MTTVHAEIDIEQALLGTMLLSEEARRTAAAAVDVADFATPSNSEIFRAILALHAGAQGVDALTVESEWAALDVLGGLTAGDEDRAVAAEELTQAARLLRLPAG